MLKVSSIVHSTTASILVAAMVFVSPLAPAQSFGSAPTVEAALAKVPATVTNNLVSAANAYVVALQNGNVPSTIANNMSAALSTYIGVLNDEGVIAAANAYIQQNPDAIQNYQVSTAQLDDILAKMHQLGLRIVNVNGVKEALNPNSSVRATALSDMQQEGLAGMLQSLSQYFVPGATPPPGGGLLGIVGQGHFTLASYHPLPTLTGMMFVMPQPDCNFLEAFGITAGLFGFEVITAVCLISYAIYCENQ